MFSALQCCFVSTLFIDLFENIVFIELLFEFYFIDGLDRWSRITLAISCSSSKIGIAFAIITIDL